MGLMINLAITVLIVFVVLLFNELWWRSRKIHGEFSRKFVHVSVGSFVAFWPFYLSWRQIEIMSLAFFVVVLASKLLKLFQAIQSVQRPTWGELFFAITVGAIAIMTHNKWIYAAALLQMSLADGLAAVIGLRFGGRISYRILGHTKSVAGTLTFFVVSMLVLVLFSHFSHIHLTLIRMIGISAASSVLENVAILGLDNLLVPLFVAFLLIHQ